VEGMEITPWGGTDRLSVSPRLRHGGHGGSGVDGMEGLGRLVDLRQYPFGSSEKLKQEECG
jgi:hypothetical protein